MAGTMREKPPGSGKWELRISVGRDPKSGKYKQRSLTFVGSEAKASKELARLVTETEQNGKNPSTLKFSALLDDWQSVRGPKWSPLTRDTNETIVRVHIEPGLGHKQIRSLRAEDFDRFYSSLSNGGLSESYIQRIHSVCSSALGYAVKREWIARNVASLAERPKDGPTLRDNRDLPELEPVRTLLENITLAEPEWGRLFWVSLATGARRGEMAGLQVRSVDKNASTLRIERQVVVPKRTKEQRAKKEEARRVVKNVKSRKGSRPGRTWLVSPEVMAILNAQMEFMRVRAKEAGCSLGSSAYVWSDEADGAIPLRPDALTKRWAKYRKKTGLESLRLHDLRHLTGTHLNGLGVDPATISYLLGHSRNTTTMDIYVDRVIGADASASQAWSKRLHGS